VTQIDLPEFQVLGLRAENPSPFTLTGTNSWIYGGRPAWLIDPGPALTEHVQALVSAITERGGLGGIALTHDHRDHDEAVPAIRSAFPDAPLAGARGNVDRVLAGGARFGPLEAVATPGHAPDHLAYVAGRACFTGDAVLGQGSVFIAPDPGALAGYLAGLRALAQRDLGVLCPGHGPPVNDPQGKLREYIDHRLHRERLLLDALRAGARTVAEMLDAAWPDVPEVLRPAATVTLAAHLDKLAGEGRLPAGVQRPAEFTLSEPPG
jgi:glyoxylase-like metal-dependent hydrolase (beta-lactamase superfamily II)